MFTYYKSKITVTNKNKTEYFLLQLVSNKGKNLFSLSPSPSLSPLPSLFSLLILPSLPLLLSSSLLSLSFVHHFALAIVHYWHQVCYWKYLGFNLYKSAWEGKNNLQLPLTCCEISQILLLEFTLWI